MTALETLKKYWGYDAFRPLQADIVDSVLAGNDTLGLMPTGGGKSITFQVPGMMTEGLTVVVTPLISLMKDQVDNLKKRGIRAVFLHSGMTGRERTVAREKLMNGNVKFLYVAPERIANDNFINDLRRLRVNLIVVDEAHCISQWGYDFRPAYLGISRMRKVKPGVPVLALTATATPEVADDICRQLQMTDPAVFRMSFTRDNINYIVRPCNTKIDEVFHILSRTAGSAIVYVRSRRRTADIAGFLNASGISAAAYHAGLGYETKEERQNAWQRGETRVMVATNAFGMGIDKPDVRVVIHYDIPPGLEEYYQEAGRAGRDGLRSYAVLLTARADKGVLRRRISEAFPDRDYIRKVYERICNNLGISVGEGYDTLREFDLENFCAIFGYQPRVCLSAIHILGRAGYLNYMEDSDRRSRVMMTCRREELYDFHGLSPEAEKVLTAVLREYTGIFAEYSYISEANLSRSVGLTEEEIYASMLELNRAKVLSYIPRSRVPLMHFPTSREEPRYIEIGRSVYDDRRDIMTRRIEAMIDYAFNSSICRENRMLEYFGEEKGEPCGRCDTCRTRRAAAKTDPRRLIGPVMEYLRQRPDGAEIRIMALRLGVRQEALSRPLGYLAGEELITVSEGWISLRE